MKILVLNSGSSSIKYKLFESEDGKLSPMAEGGAERIGIDGSFIKHKVIGKGKDKIEMDLPDHTTTIDAVLKILVDKKTGVLGSVEELGAVGHRVVHGGEDFTESVIVTDDVIKAIEANSVLAPLHNPPNLQGIAAVSAILPSVKQVAVFDTAVHQSMPPKAFRYAIPEEQYKKHKIRRYGFHGTSHGYVAKQAAEKMGKDFEDVRIITCHIGNGCSIAAFNQGKVIDTSMGLTPLEGVAMGTRSGDMDPYIPLHIMKTQGLSVDDVSNMFNKESGMLAMTGMSDMRDVEDAAVAGEPVAVLGLDMYMYRITKYVGAYMAAMQGVDAVVFTAGVGEHSPIVRKGVLSNFAFAGLKLNEEKNEKDEECITTPDSVIKAFVIPTDEEGVIAKDTYALVK